ncbi:MAG: leucine-rich repeat protein [Clostridia bacterium]|nr:leucine-rich repeat protein [Clostridia bacterium]
MKKLISVVLTLAMLLSMSVPMLANASAWPGSDAMYTLDDAEGFSAVTTSGSPMMQSKAAIETVSGFLGKDTDDYSAKITESAASDKYYYLAYKHGEEIYLEDGKPMEGYLVVDLNFYSDDSGFGFFRFGLSANQVPMTSDISAKSLRAGQWNHLRMVYAPPAACTDYEDDVPESGVTLGTTTLYINGSKIGDNTITASMSYPIDRVLLQVYSGDNTATHYAYMDDIKIYNTASDPGAPAAAVIADGEGYFAVNATQEIVYSDSITLTDIKAINPGLEMYAFDSSAYTTKLADDAVLAENNVISVKSADGFYNIYTVKSNQWQDDSGNTYTWSFSNETKEFSLGILESQKGNTNYGKISCDFSKKTRPWFGIKDIATSFSLDPAITGLARQTFDSFNALTEVTVPKQVTSWEWGTFNNCKKLKTVTYEEGCTTTGGDKMFAGCTALTTVNLASTMTNLQSRAFSGCTALKEILIPASVSGISYSKSACVFEGCTIKLKYYKNSTAAGVVKRDYTNADGTATSVTYEELTGGTLPDRDGNADSIAWNIDENGVLTVSDIAEVGTGRMHLPVSGVGNLPWNSIKGFTKIVVEDGITHLAWNLLNNTGVTISEIIIPASVETAEPYALNQGTVDSLIFEEGADKILSRAELLNRSVKLNNLYIPASAESIPANFYRSLGTDNSLEYIGNSVLNVYAQEGSEGYRWALDRKAHSKDSYTGEYVTTSPSEPAKEDYETTEAYNEAMDKYKAELSKYYAYKSVQTINVYPSLVINNDGTLASITNNSKAPVTGDVIVAYFNGNEMIKAELFANQTIAVGDNTVSIDADAGTPVVYLWKSIGTLVPMAKNK